MWQFGREGGALLEQSPPVDGEDRICAITKSRHRGRDVCSEVRWRWEPGQVFASMSLLLSRKWKASDHIGLEYACLSKESSVILTHVISWESDVSLFLSVRNPSGDSQLTYLRPINSQGKPDSHIPLPLVAAHGVFISSLLSSTLQPQVFFCVCVLSLSVVSSSLLPHGLWPARLPCPWDSPRDSPPEF